MPVVIVETVLGVAVVELVVYMATIGWYVAIPSQKQDADHNVEEFD